MEEIIDIIDEETGELSRKTISKDEAHKKGIWHSSIHLIIVNKDKTKTLFQKRCNEKKFYPNYWDVAVGGHIAHGEDDIMALKRELHEELGLNLDDYKYEKLGVFKEKLTNNGIKSNEFVHTFIIYDDIKVNDLKLQKEEVEKVTWLTKEKLSEFIMENKVINHKEEYEILMNILK